jgi:hypothetical protein
MGEVIQQSKDFFAWKERNLIGTYRTLEEAMEALQQRHLPEDLRVSRTDGP